MILVFWVDNKNFGAEHHRTQGFELDGERFTRTRFREDNHVGVFERETIKNNEAIVVHINAVENTFFLREVGGGEWKTGRNSASIHIAADLELVGTLRHSRIHALLLLRSSDFREDHLLTEDIFDFVLNKLKFVERIGVDCNVEAITEEFFGTDLELIAKVFGIGNSSFELWITNFSLFGVDGHASFELSHLLGEVFHDDTSINWIDVHGNIENFIDINDGA